MLRWFFSACVLCILLTGSVFAQGGAADFYYVSENGTPLTTACQGGVPIPDNFRPVWIMWDANNNGPDAADQPAVVCIDPPMCEQGPTGTVNYNSFQFNGNQWLGTPGYFLTETTFVTTAGLPDPPRFYLRVYEADGTTPLWTSIVYTLLSGPQEFFIQQADWTCGVGGPQCVVIDEQE